MTRPADLLETILAAFNSLSERRFTRLELDVSFDEMGADSLAMQQVLMHIEDELGAVIPDRVLESLVEARTIGEFHDLLKPHFEPA